MHDSISLIDEPATAEYVLTVLRDEHRQMAALDVMVDAEAFVSFDMTVREWREAEDLLDWRKLGRALNKSWEIDATDAEWKAALRPERTKTLADVCGLIARKARRMRIQPAPVLGCDGKAAGAFLAARTLLERHGVDVKMIAPSTPIADVARAHYQVFLGPISRLAPGRLPVASLAISADHVEYWHFFSGIAALASALLAAVTGEGLLMVPAMFLHLVVTLVAAFDAPSPPECIEFGELRTFRDLAMVLAEPQGD